MAAANWTNQQVINQLVTGYSWTGGVITYAFPTITTGMAASNETSGFTSLNATQQYFASLALSLWDDVMGADFALTTSSNSNIEFGNSSVGVGYAHAYLPTYGTVWFSSDYSDLMSPTIGKISFMTYAHEIGHALGLDHMGDYNGSGVWTPSSYQDSTVYSIMSYFGPNWGSGAANGEGLVAWADWIGADGKLYSPQTPMLHDIMAIQTVYGAETTTRTGDSVYGFNSNLGGQSGGIFDFTLNTNPILCIYDSAGNDTIDLSGWSTSCVINLAPGSFSFGNSMTYNISIAYNCYIENGVGGSNADILTGNDLANFLNGLGGNDTLNGGLGNDTLNGGSGSDTAVFSGTFASYTVSYDAATATYTITGSEGTDTVTGVELFEFSDGTKTAAQLITVPVTPVVSVSAVTTSAAEGNSGTTIFTFQISLSAAATSAQTVNYTVAGTGAAPANSADFAGALTGVVSFAAGETSKTIQVLVVGDTLVELNETFAVTLSGASSGLVLGTIQAIATITNDDASAPPPVPVNVITGTDANNVLNGTSGVDEINGLGGNDTLNGVDGDDTLNGGSGNDALNGGSGNDTLNGESENDTLVGGSGSDILNGGDGWDTASYAGSSAVNVNLGTGVASGGDAAGDTFVSIENLKGSSFADVLIGSATANILDGGLGNDTLNSGAGNDTLIGGGGNDSLNGGSGNDTLNGGSENDSLIGGSGNDTLYGELGNDALVGGSGSDILNGGDGWDTVSYAGSSAVNVNLGTGVASGGDAAGDTFVSIENLKGSSFADVLIGSATANILDGGLDNDTLNGGAGNDTLTGGAGADTFIFSDTVFGKDKITDYQDGSDKLSFSLSVADSFDDFVITGNGTNIVTVTHGADSIIVTSSAAFTLAADDFIFV